MRRGLTAVAALACAGPSLAQDLTLTPPLDCDPGAACFIQQYVDTDPGPGARDFTCGPLSYDGHKGTDFALPSLDMMAAGVAVVAAAPGVVRGVRDGMADISADAPGSEDLDGRECGNGVVLVHADGWETQYCHLRQGSVAVVQGQAVAAGDTLGLVGLSGRTVFPHVHLSVRRDGRVVDPFSPEGAGQCGIASEETLWATPLAYVPGGLIATGFSDGIPDYADVKAGVADRAKLSRASPALVLWSYVFGARAGDVLRLQLIGPDGPIVDEDLPIDRNQAQLYRAVGKRRPASEWPAGPVEGEIMLIRDGRVVDSERVRIALE